MPVDAPMLQRSVAFCLMPRIDFLFEVFDHVLSFVSGRSDGKGPGGGGAARTRDLVRGVSVMTHFKISQIRAKDGKHP